MWNRVYSTWRCPRQVNSCPVEGRHLTLDGTDAGRWHPDGSGYGTHMKLPSLVPQQLQRHERNPRAEGIMTTSGRYERNLDDTRVHVPGR